MKLNRLINVVLVAFVAYLAFQKFFVNKPEKDIDLHEITLQDLDGNIISRETLIGQPIFLNFWASWCKPCLLEMPSIEKLHNKFQDEEIRFLIVSTESKAAVKKYKEKKNRDLPYFILKNSGNIPIKSIPLTYLIDENGEVQKVVNRTKNWNSLSSQKQVRNLIRQ